MQWVAFILFSLAVVDCQSAERLQLDGTHVSVAAPSGFVLHEGLVSDHPSMTFNLPPDQNGVRTLHPSLSLSLSSAIRVEALVEQSRADAGKEWLIEPRTIEIAGASALEFARNGPTIMHLSGGGTLERTDASHLIIVSLGQQHYECVLTTSPESYSLYAPRLYEFCGSIQVSD